MKFLEELEYKVLSIISRNKELCSEVDVLKHQVAQLAEENDLLQKALLDSKTHAELAMQDKESIQATVESLLLSIESLEKCL